MNYPYIKCCLIRQGKTLICCENKRFLGLVAMILLLCLYKLLKQKLEKIRLYYQSLALETYIPQLNSKPDLNKPVLYSTRTVQYNA